MKLVDSPCGMVEAIDIIVTNLECKVYDLVLEYLNQHYHILMHIHTLLLLQCCVHAVVLQESPGELTPTNG